MLNLLREILPKENMLTNSAFVVRRLIKYLGLDYKMIHAFQNDFILYNEKYEVNTKFPTCGKSRWNVDAHSRKVHNGVLTKVLRYFPL